MKSIKLLEMLEDTDYSRPGFFGLLTTSLAAAELGMFGSVDTQFSKTTQSPTTAIEPGANSSFGTLKQTGKLSARKSAKVLAGC